MPASSSFPSLRADATGAGGNRMLRRWGMRTLGAGRFGPWQVVALAMVALLAVLSLMPLYWMVVTAIQEPTLAVKLPPEWFPKNPTTANFAELLSRPLLGRWTLNSAVVAVAVTATQLFVAALAGYAFAKKQFAGRNLLFWLYVGSMMIPGQVTLIPRYILMSKIGFINTYYGLILPSISAPFGVFLMKQFMQTLPGEIIDAGRIDGASEFGIFRLIIAPLAKPALAVLGIFTFVGEWNDFLWPLVITNSSEMRTLQVGLAMLQEEVPMAFGLLMAGATYAAIPITIVFLAFQRYFLKGLTVGALKG
ncbi:MAG: carbohydrate ABC transporter permease [Bacillota bacterium]